MDQALARKRYAEQKEAARQRGIPFHFTFPQWVNWWETNCGPDWLEKRGHRDGQYVMARIKDQGPYSPANVKCITSNENHSETALNGTSTKGVKNPMARLSETDIIEIYMSDPDDMDFICQKHRIKPTRVYNIKKRKGWAHVTKDLPPAKLAGYAKGVKHGCARLTEAQVLEIYFSTDSLTATGKRYGMGPSRVMAIKDRKSWKSLTANLGPAPRVRGQGVRVDLMKKSWFGSAPKSLSK